ncbi:hypothetical protein [Streptomyces sp. NPDC051214]|uniref:hypothetical protein n=1 Tax=Streptomyces sp. NPDC051214 TaxID=3155282 RepID=UPI0034372F3F
MDEVWIVSLWLVSAKCLALLGLWLRLCWCARQDRQRQRYLLQITEAVAAEGQVELDDWGSSGHRLRVKIIRVPDRGEVQDR